MPIYRLRDEIVFPDPAKAEWPGIVAVGGDLSVARLLAAYAAGIFPWYEKGQPILWWSPDPRLVLEPGDCHVSRSLRKRIRAGRYEVRLDTAFERVIRRCAEVPRPGQEGTWITEDMIAAYVELHRLGFAHSTEAWEGKELAGGLYGVAIGSAYFGESMFAERSDASKVAFVRLVERLREWSFDLIDCQMTTPHLLRFGAREIPRDDFLARLGRAVRQPMRRGPWT